MWAAIQKKTNKQTNKQTNHNACSHASSASNVHAFSTLYDGRNEKGQTCEGLSSERPKNKQDKELKDKKSNRQNEKRAKIRSPKQYEDKKLIGPCGRVRKQERTI